MRLHQRLMRSHEFVPLEPSKGRYLNDELVLDAVLRKFSRMLPAAGGLTLLDLLARRILAIGLEPLVRSGEVPSQDRDGALHALRMRPVETFDFHNDDAVTAQWAKANFALLGPRLTNQLAERLNARSRPVAWWVELLFRYSCAPLEQTGRNGSLFDTVFGDEISEAEMHERLVTFLNLAGLVINPVLVLDEVEGLSSCPEAGLELATFLNALHQSCQKLALIISVNGDVWQTAFLPRLPCGLKDRLNDIVVDLKPISKEDALSILRDRAGDRADAIAAVIDFDKEIMYPRGLVREASAIWSEMVAAEVNDLGQPAEAGEMTDEAIAGDAGGGVVAGFEPQSSGQLPGQEVTGQPESSKATPFRPDVVMESNVNPVSGVANPTEDTSDATDSPFSIDPEAAAVAGSPIFQSPDSEQDQDASTGSPFSVHQDVVPTPSVTQEDHDKIEDLLKQFRDRHGRG